MLKKIESPNLQLLFDIGNSIDYGYNSLVFLRKIIKNVKHVHIKDAIRENGKTRYTFPEEGEAQVKDCLELLIKSNYNGLFSIEPHLSYIPHLRKTNRATKLLDAYIEYGRKTKEILSSLYKR